MKVFFTLVLVYITNISFCQITTLNIGKVKPKNYYEEITFEFIEGKIIIPVNIEGKRYSFLFDTGSPNIISSTSFDSSSYKITDKHPISDSNNISESIDISLLKELKIGNILFKNTTTLIYNLNSNPFIKCLDIDGVIGSNMLRNSIVQINLADKKLIITNKKKNLKLNFENSTELFLDTKQSNPTIKIKLMRGNHIIPESGVLIDTGAYDLYQISKDIYNQTLKYKELKVFDILGKSNGYSSLGLYKKITNNDHFRLLIPTLMINNFEIKNHITNTSNSNNSIIGTELLEYGTMTIDYKNKRFYFDSHQEKIDNSYDLLGLELTIKDDKMIVGFVWDESLKNKIFHGDEILEINDVIIAKLSICDIFFKNLTDSNTVKLKVKSKKGKIIEIITNKKKPKYFLKD